MKKFIRDIVWLLLVLALSGCGGGGGDTSVSDDVQRVFGFEGEEVDIDSRYSGSITAAQLTAGNSGKFLAVIFDDEAFLTSDTPKQSGVQISVMATQRNAPINGGIERITNQLNNKMVNYYEGSSLEQEKINLKSIAFDPVPNSNNGDYDLCVNGGEIHYADGVDGDGLEVIYSRFDSCEIDGMTFNGVVEFKITNVIDGWIQDSVIKFKGLDVTGPKIDYSMFGELRDYFPDGSNSNCREHLVANILIEDNLSNRQYRLSDFTAELCLPMQQSGYLHGRIFISDYGYVDVRTLMLLEYEDYASTYPDKAGLMILDGDEKSQAKYEVLYENTPRVQLTGWKTKLLSLSIDTNGDGIDNYSSVMRPEIFILGGGMDIDDTDGDGLPNSWEKVQGLDPENSLDGVVDSDGDGFINVIEYDHFGLANDAEIKPVSHDLSMRVTFDKQNARAGQEIIVRFGAHNNTEYYDAKNVLFNVKTSSNVTWVATGTSICHARSIVDNELTCFEEREGYGGTITIRLDSPGEFYVEASVISDTFDPDIGNNSVTVSGEFFPRKVNVGISDYSGDITAVIGETRSYDFMLTSWGPDEGRNAVFTIDKPDSVLVNSAQYTMRVPPYASGSCVVTARVICELGRLQQADLSFELVGLEEDIAEIRVSLSADGIEQNESDNERVFTLYSGIPLASFQDEIDQADAGSTIVIPGGIYIGRLNLGGNNKRIESAAGAELTTIVGEVSVGDGDSVSGFSFFGQGGGIKLYGQNSRIEDNIFNIYGANIIGIRGGVAGVTTSIERNVFTQSKKAGSICHFIGFEGGVSSSYLVANNIFFNSDCYAVTTWFYSSSNIGSERIIANNTFYSVYGGVSFLGAGSFPDVEAGIATQYVYNNIFVNNDVAVSLRNTNGLTAVSNNLFYDNNEDLFSRISVYEWIDNAEVDPLFVDQSNNDFRITQSSPAVDSGLFNDKVVTDVDSNYRPNDGNNDGISMFDIGAYEYY